MNENNYILSLNRQEVCELMLACTQIVCDAHDEMEHDQSCPEYRRTHVLPNTIQKWQSLHDKIAAQLDILDALNT